MPRKPRWWYVLQDSKNEVRLAVDLYNRSGVERQLEAFIVHMSLGWLKLLQAHFEQSGLDIYVRDERGWRIKHPDGGYKHRGLHDLAKEHFAENDPRKANLSFFTGLRNIIEHRYERDIAALVAGKTQAYLLNYEITVVELFGEDEGLAAELRFPLFLSSITGDAVNSLKKVRARIPRGVLEWVQDFDTSVEPDIAVDQRFEFKVYLIPHKGAKTDADAAMTFVHEDELTEEQKGVMDQVRTIIRDRTVPIGGVDEFLPGAVVEQVNAQIDREFTMYMHTQAWKYFNVRPATGAVDKFRTKTQFCYWNQLVGKYVYTPAWVAYLVRKLSDNGTYDVVAAVNLAD
ncbi:MULTISPECIES: DUF3644 domain-containing protein [Mycobacterium]|uniref:DUF3644 domain-containing protein n=1 Tax=Mycobacterium TaxID=1763 RepID=UPI000618178C|nr:MULTISPECIES: DUF3644 domain-containing protein [Mycobacterium]KKC06128.1 hypothetical protein WU83_04540 [Mycobacterium nebraskense]BCO39158.1 hypothetical protein MINTM001_02970 [Mycobacterium paraintracellulare]